jgi:hypothetical protein
MEFTASTFALIAAAAPVEVPRIDRHPAYVAAIMYAAPAVPGLLQRLEQDRRMVIALGRRIESSFDVVVATPWGERTPRRMLTEVLLGDAARCALALERRATTDEA